MAGPRIDGKSPMYWTEFRPDPNYPSEVSYAVWIDMKIARLELVAGSHQPGGAWGHPFYVAPAELPRLMAAFNGGFQFRAGDARGGYYSERQNGGAARDGGGIAGHLQKRASANR